MDNISYFSWNHVNRLNIHAKKGNVTSESLRTYIIPLMTIVDNHTLSFQGFDSSIDYNMCVGAPAENNKTTSSNIPPNEGDPYVGYFSGRESVTFTTPDISSLSQWMLYVNWGSPMKYMTIMYQISNNAPITHIQ